MISPCFWRWRVTVSYVTPPKYASLVDPYVLRKAQQSGICRLSLNFRITSQVPQVCVIYPMSYCFQGPNDNKVTDMDVFQSFDLTMSFACDYFAFSASNSSDVHIRFTILACEWAAEVDHVLSSSLRYEAFSRPSFLARSYPIR